MQRVWLIARPDRCYLERKEEARENFKPGGTRASQEAPPEHVTGSVRIQPRIATKQGFKDGDSKMGTDSRPERVRAVVDQSLERTRRRGAVVTKMLILGANGQLARNTTRVMLRDTDADLTLYLRRASRLTNPDPKRVTVVEGDVLDASTLKAAMKGQDVVYANLAGDMKPAAEHIIEAMHAAGVRRLVFISSMGIYGEVPGERYRSVLDPYRDSAAAIEASDLDYTVLRPGWFTNDPKVSYHLTQKGQPFKGHDVTLNSLSDLIAKLATTPGLHVRQSLGVSSP